MLARVLALELLARQFEELRARRLVVGQCAAWIPLRAPIGRGRPAMHFGGLARLAYRGGCPQGCAHTHRVHHQIAMSSMSVKWQDMRGRSAPMQHLQRAGMQSGGAEGCIAQERQRQSAASHKSVVRWQSRIASLARGSRGGPKFAQVCSWLNVPHFGQRAVYAKHLGHVLGSC